MVRFGDGGRPFAPRESGRHRGQSREVRVQIPGDHLEQVLGAIEVLEPVLTEIPEPNV
jgi:hypothetical protein